MKRRDFGLLGAGFVAATVASAAVLWPEAGPGRVEFSRSVPAISPTVTVEQPAVADDGLLHYVAIGDSITGTGVAAPGGWARQFAATIAADGFTNLAETAGRPASSSSPCSFTPNTATRFAAPT